MMLKIFGNKRVYLHIVFLLVKEMMPIIELKLSISKLPVYVHVNSLCSLTLIDFNCRLQSLFLVKYKLQIVLLFSPVRNAEDIYVTYK